MSTNELKRNAEDESSSDESSDEVAPNDNESSSDDATNESDQNINVEFEAENPFETDFHGIKQLLLRALLLLHVDVSELTDLIISQETVGSTVKIADNEDEDVYGIFSAISLKKYKEKNCIKELQKELLSKCKACEKENYKVLENIFESKNVGYLVNERFINIPAQLAVPFHDSLCEEVKAQKSEDSGFDFDYMLLISKTLKPKKMNKTSEDNSAAENNSNSKKKKKKQNEAEDNSNLEYTNFEDELFHKACDVSFSYNVTEATGLAVSGNWDFQDQPMKTYRTVMLMKVHKWKGVIASMKEMVNA